METKYYEIKITWCNDLRTVIVIEEGWVTEIISKILSLEMVKIEVKEVFKNEQYSKNKRY